MYFKDSHWLSLACLCCICDARVKTERAEDLEALLLQQQLIFFLSDGLPCVEGYMVELYSLAPSCCAIYLLLLKYLNCWSQWTVRVPKQWLTLLWNNNEVVIEWLFSEKLWLSMYEFCIKNVLTLSKMSPTVLKPREIHKCTKGNGKFIAASHPLCYFMSNRLTLQRKRRSAPWIAAAVRLINRSEDTKCFWIRAESVVTPGEYSPDGL